MSTNFLKEHSYGQGAQHARSQPKGQLLWKAAILSPCSRGASFAIHAISMPTVMVQACPSPNSQ